MSRNINPKAKLFWNWEIILLKILISFFLHYSFQFFWKDRYCSIVFYFLNVTTFKNWKKFLSSWPKEGSLCNKYLVTCSSKNNAVHYPWYIKSSIVVKKCFTNPMFQLSENLFFFFILTALNITRGSLPCTAFKINYDLLVNKYFRVNMTWR